MKVLSYQLTITKKLLFNLLFFLIIVYFIFHTIYGDRGLIAYFKLNRQLAKAQAELKLLRAERVESEHNAWLLKIGDRDMIDEQARHILGVASPKEQVFTTADNNNN